MSFNDIHEDSIHEKIQHGDIRFDSPDELAKLELETQKLMFDQRQKFLGHVLENNRTRLVEVSQVFVNNSHFYRDDFLKRQLQPLLASHEPMTLQQFCDRIDQTTKNLVNTTGVENLAIQVDKLPDYYQRSTGPMKVAPLFHLVPVKRHFARTGTNVGNGEGDGYLTLQLRNFLNGGENLIFDATVGTRTRSSYLMNLNFPIKNSPNLRLENLVYSNTRKNEWTSHDEAVKGLSNRLVKKHADLPMQQELAIENLWRSIEVSDAAASNMVYLSAGDSFKSSVVYNIKYDTRDNSFLPRKGFYSKLQMEYTPSIGSLFKQASNFLKTSFETQSSAVISQKLGLITNLSLKGGYIHSMDGSNVHLMDKFYLGGATNIRGFNYNSLGPNMKTSILNKNSEFYGGDKLGGNYFYAVGLSLFTGVPYFAPKLENNFKLHWFLNAGNLSNSLDNTFWSKPSLSCGTGLVFNHSIARFELNFALPLASHTGDGLRKGFQYGVGLSFM